MYCKLDVRSPYHSVRARMPKRDRKSTLQSCIFKFKAYFYHHKLLSTLHDVEHKTSNKENQTC